MSVLQLKHRSLAAKLMLAGLPFVLLALVATSSTLWVSWQLDGGAAAVNEAGRMRMQTYRIALSASTGQQGALLDQIREFEASLALLRLGDPDRPLFVPWDSNVQERFATIERDWTTFRALLLRPPATAWLQPATSDFVRDIDFFVHGIEIHISRWTAILHLLQTALMVLVIIGAVVLLYVSELLVIEPLEHLKHAIEKIQGGDFDARVGQIGNDEFGTLAEGFNDMAAHLQAMYRHLEARVAEKTAELEEKRGRLESLYEITALVGQATTLDELAQGMVRSLGHITHADGVALRWYDQHHGSYLILASHGLPAELLSNEQCIPAGACDCGLANAESGSLRVIPLHALDTADAPPSRVCARSGFKTVVTVPIRQHERLMGEIDLFHHARIVPSAAERSLLEVLSSHLAGAIENLRLNALEKEAAVAQERHLLARELHDSIAQSLAFLKIQVQLMRDALAAGDQQQVRQVLDEIDTGVRESYGDVRELLVHFRTRTNAEDIEPALQTTLHKFELQSGLKAHLSIQGHGLPLPPDLQIQVLHIVQEALSNVRKHAHATQVWLDVQQQPEWRFEVRDDGAGFEHAGEGIDETHVGLHIMQERAERIGARLEVFSTPGSGTSVILTLPPLPTASPPFAPPSLEHAPH